MCTFPLTDTQIKDVEGMARRATTRPEKLVAALPAELWQCIASHMDVKIWSKTAAPTCKGLWKLQLLDCIYEGGATGLASHLLAQLEGKQLVPHAEDSAIR